MTRSGRPTRLPINEMAAMFVAIGHGLIDVRIPSHSADTVAASSVSITRPSPR